MLSSTTHVAGAQVPGGGSKQISRADLPLLVGPAAPSAVAETMALGRADLDAGRWADAARRLQWALSRAPLDGEDWRSLMRAELRLRDWAGASRAADSAYRLGTSNQREVALSAAAAYGQAGAIDSGFVWLRRALIDERFEARPSLESDPDLAPLRRDPRWAKLVLPPAAPSDRVAGWRTDIRWLLDEIDRLNAPAREKAVPDHVRAMATRLSADVPKLSDVQVTVGLMQLLAALGRSHNGLWPWVPSRHGGINQAPISLFAFAGGDVRIVHASAPFTRLVGYRVKAVGDRPALDGLALVGSVVERENEMDLLWRGPEFLASPDVLHALGASSRADSLRLVLQGAAGDSVVVLPAAPMTRRVVLGPSPRATAPVPLALRRATLPFWYEWLSDDRVAYVAFNGVRDAEDETLDAFGRRLSGLLAANPPRAVVVDLRRNNGGNTYLYTSLLRTLVAWDARRDGVLYALIGRNTFSAAMNFVTDLDRLTNVVFVGEPTGGKPGTHGDESAVVLPWSGLHGGLSAVYWQIGSPRDMRRWIAPQLFVPPTAGDWLANRDVAMETILTRERARRQAGSSNL